MRTSFDRIRHAILFEAVALILVAPLGGLIFDFALADFGVVALVSTTIAMVWNYAFNLGFDRVLLRVRGEVRKPFVMRLVHTAVFEIGLTCLLVPFIAWYLGVSLLQALLMDVSLIGFYAVYAFAFNWAYDTLVPASAERQ